MVLIVSYGLCFGASNVTVGVHRNYSKWIVPVYVRFSPSFPSGRVEIFVVWRRNGLSLPVITFAQRDSKMC